MSQKLLTEDVESLRGVRLAKRPPGSVWDITFTQPNAAASGIRSITPHSAQEEDNDDSYPLVLPALVHPHIHLDKAFVHGVKEYADLLPSTGTFQEALSFTSQAKARFTLPDLLRRGGWLIAESVAAGVTAMRAFLEVDSVVQETCLEAGVQLKQEWKDICHIQLVCFAQDPIFSGEHGEENRTLMEEAIRNAATDVIGTTPYVESSVEASKRNIEWAIDRAWRLGKHVDFHLDYNLDRAKEPLVWHVLQTLKAKGWTTNSKGRVMLGHCTRLTLFSDDEWRRLSEEIRENNLPVSFVGLPTSDLYMAAHPENGCDGHAPHARLRGTLQVLDMIRTHELDAVIGINNVGNAFTPWGNLDPLSVGCLGVGIYQCGTQSDTELLYECISTRARAAIGLADSISDMGLTTSDITDLLVVSNVDQTGLALATPRIRRTVADVVWDPPQGWASRDVISGARLILKQRREASASENIILVNQRRCDS
jgi:cytosine/adenosine deaminase-related metal-dependent hydrolase